MAAPFHAVESALNFVCRGSSFPSGTGCALHTTACICIRILLPKVDRSAPFLPDRDNLVVDADLLTGAIDELIIVVYRISFVTTWAPMALLASLDGSPIGHIFSA